MILIVNVCHDPLHHHEFVKPIEDILDKAEIAYITKHYTEVKENLIRPAKKIIICGTSLKDNRFVKNIAFFSWMKGTDKPLLGICAGMQIMGLLSGGKLKKKTEIGFYDEEFVPFLGIEGNQQVYHLHNHYIDFSKLKEFEVLSKGKLSQAVKHKEKPQYGVLFHPEVRQKQMIVEFCRNA